MRTLIIFLLALHFTNRGDAQFLKFGLKGGANLVKINGVSFKDGYNLGYYAGAFTEIKINDKWYLQPELLFGETELSFSDEFEDIYEDLLSINRLTSIKFQRISIPITINYKLANIFSLSAGPQFSIINDRGETLLKNAGNAFSKGDIGILAGGNIMIGKFRLNARYIWGLKDLNNIDGSDAWKAQTAQLGVGFVF